MELKRRGFGSAFFLRKKVRFEERSFVAKGAPLDDGQRRVGTGEDFGVRSRTA
jgi:hypothetical protein